MLPLTPFAVAVIVAAPTLTALASPVAASIVATAVSLLVHVTGPLPMTATGVEELLVVPLPSCPAKFRPQHRTVPSGRRAQVCHAAVRTADEGSAKGLEEQWLRPGLAGAKDASVTREGAWLSVLGRTDLESFRKVVGKE